MTAVLSQELERVVDHLKIDSSVPDSDDTALGLTSAYLAREVVTQSTDEPFLGPCLADQDAVTDTSLCLDALLSNSMQTLPAGGLSPLPADHEMLVDNGDSDYVERSEDLEVEFTRLNVGQSLKLVGTPVLFALEPIRLGCCVIKKPRNHMRNSSAGSSTVEPDRARARSHLYPPLPRHDACTAAAG